MLKAYGGKEQRGARKEEMATARGHRKQSVQLISIVKPQPRKEFSISRSAKHKDALLCNKEAFAFDFSRLLLVLEDWDINHFATVLC